MLTRLWVLALPVLWICVPTQSAAQASASRALEDQEERVGKPRTGKASWYGKKFAGKTMADGTPMDPEASIAASRTLPLGSKARVTNLDNGKSVVVDIRDRGPYIDGRIIDLSASAAKQLDILEDGVATVEVTPLHIPENE